MILSKKNSETKGKNYESRVTNDRSPHLKVGKRSHEKLTYGDEILSDRIFVPLSKTTNGEL